MIYAVIDTNVIVSALLSRHSNAATVQVVRTISKDKLCPLYNEEIFEEYEEVLNRKKFRLPPDIVQSVLRNIRQAGMAAQRIESQEHLPDPKDIVFYEVAMSKDDAYLVTGNTKHFPQKPIVVTPAEMVEILADNGLLE